MFQVVKALRIQKPGSVLTVVSTHMSSTTQPRPQVCHFKLHAEKTVVTLQLHWPPHAVFVTCSMKFLQNFVLQASNAEATQNTLTKQ